MTVSRGSQFFGTILARAGIAFFIPLLIAASSTAPQLRIFTFKPSQVDPAVQNFDAPSVILLGGGKSAPLVVFLSGTAGKPAGALRFLEVIAKQGFNVISLAYDDVPAVAQVCTNNPAPDCSAKFREMRVYGTGHVSIISNSVPESIEARLTSLLQVLAIKQPERDWHQFLNGSSPRWDRIIVSGMSQGAGMAAFIAKRSLTRRVVLFSSPWDTWGPKQRPAPWLSDKSATPPNRWFAEYHRREKTAAQIARAYARLGIPADHIWLFNENLPVDMTYISNNPYHVSTISNFAYMDRWLMMFGAAAPPETLR